MKKTSVKSVIGLSILAFLLCIGAHAIAGEGPQSALAEKAGISVFVPFGTYTKKPPYKIGLSSPFGAVNWCQQWIMEFEEECQAYEDIGLISKWYVTEANFDANTQINQVEDMLAKGLDGLVISPVGMTALVPLLDKLYDEGKIPFVVTMNRNESPKTCTSRLSDDPGFGRLGGEWLVEQITKRNGKPEGNIIVLEGVPAAGPNVGRWVEGAKPVFDSYPGIKVVGIGAGNWDYPQARAVAESLVAANPKIDGVWTAGGQMTLAVLDVFLAKGRPLVPMAGEDYNGLMKAWKKYKDKGFETFLPCKPTWMVRHSVQTLVNMLRGMTVKRHIWYDCPFITWDMLDTYLRPDLPDVVWANSTLNDDQFRKLYRIKKKK